MRNTVTIRRHIEQDQLMLQQQPPGHALRMHLQNCIAKNWEVLHSEAGEVNGEFMIDSMDIHILIVSI